MLAQLAGGQPSALRVAGAAPDGGERLWDALVADGGKESDCGWCKDRFGFSWQVVPTQFFELLSSGTPEQSGRVMAAMNTMQKFDVAALQAAYDG